MSTSNNNSAVEVADSSSVKNLVDEFYPVNCPLAAKYKKTFAFKTIGFRLPVILTKVIDQLSREKNEIGERLGSEARNEIKDITGQLAKLKNEMQTNKVIMPNSSSVVWNTYIDKVAQDHMNGKNDDVRWYLSPWLFVECYMYFRINEAFVQSQFLKTYDPFQKQKEDGYFESLDQANVLGEFVVAADPSSENLQSLLEVILWGNRCDLSLSAGEDSSQKTDIIKQLVDLKKFILADDSSKFWDLLTKSKNEKKPISIGYVLDNSGFELFTDLCLADILFRSNYQVDEIDFYVKTSPWFVSDVLVKDFNWMLDQMEQQEEKPILKRLALRWKEHFKSLRWRIIEDEFWTYPHAFYEMEKASPKLHKSLSSKTVLIFKGDLNYRKLVGDINWKPETPFKDSLQGFGPAPLLGVRTIKADTVSGLRPGVYDALATSKPEWMTTGEYGLIQYSN